VNGASNQFLASSGLTQDQHGGIEWRHGIYLGRHVLKRRTFAYYLLDVQHGANFILQVTLFLFQLVREFADFAYARALSRAMAT
jgi:hypothetical protein